MSQVKSVIHLLCIMANLPYTRTASLAMLGITTPLLITPSQRPICCRPRAARSFKVISTKTLEEFFLRQKISSQLPYIQHTCENVASSPKDQLSQSRSSEGHCSCKLYSLPSEKSILTTSSHTVMQ